MSQIASLGRASAYNALRDLLGDDARLQQYTQAKDCRLWSKAGAASGTTTAVPWTFFNSVAAGFGNLPIAGQLGDFFFLCHDVRVMICEASGILAKELDVANFGANFTLTLKLENRPVIDKELLGLYLIGAAGRFGITGTGSVVGACEPGANSGHHCMWATTPGQAINASADPMTAPAVTTATWAHIILFGWKFSRPSAA